MSALIKNCVVGCLKAATVPALAAPLVYVLTFGSSFEIFDFFFSIFVGAWVGLQVLAFVGFPVLVLLSHLHFNSIWLVALIGCGIGVYLGISAPSPLWSVVVSYGLIGAVTGGCASHYASPNTPPNGGAPVS
jgi:hypothetical protein